MTAESITPHHQSGHLFWYWTPSVKFLKILATLFAISSGFVWIFVPRLIRKYATGFKIGNVGLFTLKDIEWCGHRVWVKGKGMVMRSELKSKLEADGIGERTRVRLGCVGLRCGFGKREGARRQWIALRVTNVWIRIPKAHLESCEDSNKPSQRESSSNHDDSPSSPPGRFNLIKLISPRPTNSSPGHISKALRSLFIRIINPTLTVLSHLSWLVSIFSFEVNDIRIQVDQISNITCSFKIGFQLIRANQTQLSTWLTIKNIQVHRWNPTGPQPSKLKPLPESSPDLAFSLPGCVELSAGADLDPLVSLTNIFFTRSNHLQTHHERDYRPEHESRLHRKAFGHFISPHSIDFCINFFESSKSMRTPNRKGSSNISGILLALHNFIHIVRALPATSESPSQPCHSQTTPDRAQHGSNGVSGQSGIEPTTTSFSPLSILRRFEVELPFITCTHLPTLSLHRRSSATDPHPLNSIFSPAISAHLTIQGLALNLNLSEHRIENDQQSTTGTHLDWFGSRNSVLWKFGARWKEVALAAELFSNDGKTPLGNLNTSRDARLGFSKAKTPLVQISETLCNLSSTWLPQPLRKKLLTKSSTNDVKFIGDHNSQMLVAEIEIGRIKGQMSVDDINLARTLDLSLESSFVQSSPSGSPSSKSAPPPDPNILSDHNNKGPANINSKGILRDFPKLATIISLQSFSFDLGGPSVPGPAAFGPGSANDISQSNSNVWRSSDMLTLGCSALHLTIFGEYVALCLKRTEHQKREARKRAKTNEVFVPTSLRDVFISQAHTSAVIGDRDFNDPEAFLESQEGRTRRISDRHVGGNLRNSKPALYAQAYPLPILKANPSPWKSRVEIFRESNEVEFVYQCTTTLMTSSVDVVFSSDIDAQEDEHHLDHSSLGLYRLDRSRHPTSCSHHELLGIASIEVVGGVSLAGWDTLNWPDVCPVIDLRSREGTLQTVIDDLVLDLWRPNAMSSIVHLSQIMSSLTTSKLPDSALKPSRPSSSSYPRTQMCPLDISFSLAILTMSVRTASFDSKCDSEIARGTRLEAKAFFVEVFRQSNALPGLYSFPDRLRLDLKEDIRLQSNSKLLHNPEFDTCLVKCDMGSWRIVCVPDVTEALSMNYERPSAPSSKKERHRQTSSLWELKNRFPTSKSSFCAHPIGNLKADHEDESSSTASEESSGNILVSERFSCRITLQALKRPTAVGQDELIAALDTKSVTTHVDAFHLYCGLLSVSALIGLMMAGSQPPQPSDVKRAVRTRRALQVGIRAEIHAIHLHLRLSPQVPLFIEIRRLSLQRSQKLGIDIRWDTLLAAGRNATNGSFWDDILKIKTCKIKIANTDPTASPNLAAGKVNRGWLPFIVLIEGDAARLRLPFKFVIAEVIESISVLVKTTKQLWHQFIKGGYGSILQPSVESPKRLPEIQLRFRIIVLQAEDDPFENKLNAIRRAGKEEIKDRLARDESFDRRVHDLLNTGGSSRVLSGRFRQDSEPQSKSDAGSFNLSEDRLLKRQSVTSSYSSQGGEGIPQVSVEEAAGRLQEYNAATWIKRIRNAISEQERQEDGIQRQLYGHASHKVSEKCPVKVLPLPKVSPLVRVVFNSIQIALYKADCEKVEGGLMDYLHRVGKGLPRDTKFSMVVPFHLSWRMEGASIRLRDFPLYLLSMPRPQQVEEGNQQQQQRQADYHTWQLESDFVIAEEMCTIESVRTAPSLIVPRKFSSQGKMYSIEIPRTVMPVKSYANPIVQVRSMAPVRLGWGNSMQPAIQDMVRVLESLSKPPADPSDRLGFWDKVRLILHWIVEINFIGGKADVVLHLKGSRDPYELLGSGAGFAKVWRGNVKFLLGHENSDQEFLQIKSDQYILGIPNLKDLVDNAASGSAPLLTATSAASYKRRYRQASGVSDSGDESDSNDAVRARKTEFLKIVGKLTNGVRWGMGIVLERACGDEKNKTCGCIGSTFHRKCRIFEFKPHYQVVTKVPQYVITPAGERHDSFESFRSDFIHFSISLTSPTDGKKFSRRPSGQNSIYFAPEAFTHFWSWFKTFDSALSLPIRQGNLFPSSLSPSKKFGRHVATIKYRFSISPLFLAHTYKYEDCSDWYNGRSVVLGLKAKISSFNVDMHTRAVETTIRTPAMKQAQKIIRKTFYKAEVDCQDVIIRAISAVFNVPRKAAYANDLGMAPNLDESETNSILNDSPDRDEYIMMTSDFSQRVSFASGNNGRYQDKDAEWIDLDDYHDLIFGPQNDLGDPSHMKVLDVVSCPQISYLRQPSSAAHWTLAHNNRNVHASDSDVGVDGQPIERTKFGEEGTHTCLIGKGRDPMSAQVGLLDLRLRELERERDRYNVELSAPSPSSPDTFKRKEIEVRMETVKELRARMLAIKDSVTRVKDPNVMNQPSSAHSRAAFNMQSTYWAEEEQYLSEMAKQIDDENKAWSNRLLVHNPSILISNSTRDVLLKYYYCSSQRKGFMYHISARAVKFILELADQKPGSMKSRHDYTKRKSRIRSQDFHNDNAKTASAPRTEAQSLPRPSHENSGSINPDFSTDEKAEQDIPDDFMVDPADLVLLMRPQIAFKSEVDDISTVILTAYQVQLKSYEVLDSAHLDDPVNAKVMRRNFSTIRGFQVFYPSRTNAIPSQSVAGVGQSLAPQSLVPVEVLVDLRLEPWGFDRLIGRCTVDITYDNFNQLRIKRRSAGADSSFSFSSQPHLQSSTDLLRVEVADALSVHATALHYRAIYNVVTDLCLYTDPAQKKRNAALETMQYAYDVDDLSGMAEHIQEQQARIRLYRTQILEEYAPLTSLDESLIFEFTQREYNLWANASDLNLMIEAIRRSQESRRGRAAQENSVGVQLRARAKVITWHMIAENGESIAKLSVNDTNFEWSSLPDTSVTNRLSVQEMLALNISADQNRTFDEILSRYEPVSEDQHRNRSKQFLTAVWKTLPPIGGISIVESFLLDVHPIRLQIEHAIGIKVHDYLFARKAAPGDDAEPSLIEPIPRTNKSNRSGANESRPPLTRARSTSQNAPRIKRSQLNDVFSDDRRSFISTSMLSVDPITDSANRTQSRLGEATHLKPDWRSTISGPGSGLPSGGNSSRSTRPPSIISVSSDGRRGASALASTSDSLLHWNKKKTEDAAEMKKRARLYKSFAFIDVVPTTICVSYSGPKYPDIFDLVVKVPHFHFESRTWSYSEFFDEIRKTCVASLFKQSPSILGQIITTARKNKSVPRLMSQKVASGLKLKKRSFFDRNSHVSISSLSPDSRSADSSTQKSSKSGHSIFEYTSGSSNKVSQSPDPTFIATASIPDLDISAKSLTTSRPMVSPSLETHDDFGDLVPDNSSRIPEYLLPPARFSPLVLPRNWESTISSSSDRRHRDTWDDFRAPLIMNKPVKIVEPAIDSSYAFLNQTSPHPPLPHAVHAVRSETHLSHPSPKGFQLLSPQAIQSSRSLVSSAVPASDGAKGASESKSTTGGESTGYRRFRRQSDEALSSRRPMLSELADPMPALPSKHGL